MNHSLQGFLFPCLLLSIPALCETAEVYKWVDEQGAVHYSDRPRAPDARRLPLASAPDPAIAEQSRQREQRLRQSADELQRAREQREAEATQKAKEKRRQELRKQQQAAQRKKEKGKKAAREGNAQGHYQKQWQQQMPPPRRPPVRWPTGKPAGK